MSHCVFSYSIFMMSFFIVVSSFSVEERTALTKDQVLNPFARNDNGRAIANAHTKSRLPVACRRGAQQALLSFTKSIYPEVNHPDGNLLFPDDPALNGLFQIFLTNLQKNDLSKNFTVYFTKIHLLVLHELYIYLTKIYTVFNMTHIDLLVPIKDAQGKVKEGYLQEGIQQGLNQKTLIINHLINIIEAQSNGAVRARFPSLDPLVATYAGNMLMQHDYGVDLNILMDEFLLSSTEAQKAVQPTIETMRSSYFGLLSDYLKFFNRYTQTLHQDDTGKGYVGSNRFVQHAKKIAGYMQKFDHIPDPAHKTTVKDGKPEVSQEKIAWLRSLKKINPPLFFYDEQTMRGLKIVPALAKSLPKNVQKVPWPSTIVEAANAKRHIKPLYGLQTDILIAFFNKNNTRLFVNIPTPTKYIYVQELLPQPDWLNSQEGITKMLQACLGDFSALLDPIFDKDLILDPCIQCIIGKAASKAGLTVSKNDKSCEESGAFVKAINDQIAKNQASQSLPTLSDDEESQP